MLAEADDEDDDDDFYDAVDDDEKFSFKSTLFASSSESASTSHKSIALAVLGCSILGSKDTSCKKLA